MVYFREHLCQFVVSRNLWPGRSQSVRRVRCSRRWPRRSYTRAARDRQLCAAVTGLCKARLGRGETDRAVEVVCSCDSGLQTRCVQLCGCESEVVTRELVGRLSTAERCKPRSLASLTMGCSVVHHPQAKGRRGNKDKIGKNRGR